MKTFSVSAAQPDESAVEEAARILREGGLVAFPTETVYGLAVDAANRQAVDRLNQVKGRPPDKPYSIHLYDVSQLPAFVGEIPPVARQLIAKFWPGPLTIVMESKGGLPAAPGAAQAGGTVGFRLPSHPVAQAFLRRCHCAVVAPSANRSGFPPPTDAGEVLAALDGAVDCLLDAGPTPLGRESTVVSVAGGRLTILREGAIPVQTVQDAVRGGGR